MVSKTKMVLGWSAQTRKACSRMPRGSAECVQRSHPHCRLTKTLVDQGSNSTLFRISLATRFSVIPIHASRFLYTRWARQVQIFVDVDCWSTPSPTPVADAPSLAPSQNLTTSIPTPGQTSSGMAATGPAAGTGFGFTCEELQLGHLRNAFPRLIFIHATEPENE